jgi:hypothetical protein
MRKRKALIFAATAILVSPVHAETCPDPIASASRLVLVTTRSMDTQLATTSSLRASRPTSLGSISARPSRLLSAKLVLAGAIPSSTSRTVRNRRRLKAISGRQQVSSGSERASVLLRHGGPATLSSRLVRRSVWRIPPRLFTKRSEIGSVEADDMRSSPLYSSGLFVDYPSDRATRRGSCILIHIWSAPDTGTAGCKLTYTVQSSWHSSVWV